MSYYLVLCVHLLAAIIFLGFIFTDVVILPGLRDLENAKEAKACIMKRAVKIMPLMLLALILSGGYMLSFNLPMVILLKLKLFFVTLIVAGVIYSLGSKLFKYELNPLFHKYFHLFALIMGLFIVICAKLMAVIG